MHLTTTSITIADLTTEGFSVAEIARLETLRARYHPYREYCASDLDFERLAFLKWRYERGEVTDGQGPVEL